MIGIWGALEGGSLGRLYWEGEILGIGLILVGYEVASRRQWPHRWNSQER